MMFKEKTRHLSVTAVFFLVLFVLFSFFMYAHAVKSRYSVIIDEYPDLVIQKKAGGRPMFIDPSWIDQVIMIPGVSHVEGMVTGQYLFEKENTLFTIVGLDLFGQAPRGSLKQVLEGGFDDLKFSETPSMIMGRGVEKVLKENAYDKSFNFFTPEGEKLTVKKYGLFNRDLELENSDLIMVTLPLAREILGYPGEVFTELSVRTEQPLEIPTIAKKIKEIYPDSFMVSREQMKEVKERLYNYGSGFFLSLLLTSFLAFAILLYTRAMGLSPAERKNIALCRAVGWGIRDVIRWKMFEAVVISTFSFIMSFCIAYIYVFIFNGPIVRNILLGFSNMPVEVSLKPDLDYWMFFLLFVLITFFYLAVAVVPSWKVATIDAKEAMK
jgi:ABC-type lipoprotein release transport system permease subunit